MKKAFNATLALAVLASVSIEAQATPITYSFTDSGSPVSSYTKTVSSETVTVTASSTNGASSVTQNGASGLGVRQDVGGGSNSVDASSGRTESLLFSFDQLFELTSFSLSNAGRNESFTLSWGLGASILGSESLIPIGSVAINPYLVQQTAQGDWFRITAARDGSTQSSFYVSNLTVDTVSPVANSVPEPASLLLCALGLTGIAALRSKRA